MIRELMVQQEDESTPDEVVDVATVEEWERAFSKMKVGSIIQIRRVATTVSQ